MNIRDAYNASAIALVNTEVASNKIPYLGSGLFPAKKKMGLDLKGTSSFTCTIKFRCSINIKKP